MDTRGDRVLVVDSASRFVEYIAPAIARRLIREGKASLLRKVPCTVQLPASDVRLSAFGSARKEKEMTSTQRTTPTAGISSRGFVNFTTFFETEKDIWVQNVGQTQVSIEFDEGNGNKASILLEVNPDPINLTQEVAWTAIKGSRDFRRLIQRQPPVMRLISAADAEEYFSSKAERYGFYRSDDVGAQVPDAGRAMEEAQGERARRLNHINDVLAGSASNAVTVDGMHGKSASSATKVESAGLSPSNVGTGEIRIDQVVTPRVLHLCQQVSMELEPADRTPAKTLLNELQSLGNQLTLEDLNHILSFGTYPTVKKWASQLLAEKAKAQFDAEELGDDLGPDNTVGLI